MFTPLTPFPSQRCACLQFDFYILEATAADGCFVYALTSRRASDAARRKKRSIGS